MGPYALTSHVCPRPPPADLPTSTSPTPTHSSLANGQGLGPRGAHTSPTRAYYPAGQGQASVATCTDGLSDAHWQRVTEQHGSNPWPHQHDKLGGPHMPQACLGPRVDHTSPTRAHEHYHHELVRPPHLPPHTSTASDVRVATQPDAVWPCFVGRWGHSCRMKHDERAFVRRSPRYCRFSHVRP